MATLSTADADAIWALLMSEYSSINREIPVSKQEFRTFIDIVDAVLEQAEIDIVQAIPAGPRRNWLINNPVVGRSIVVRVEQKRRDVL